MQYTPFPCRVRGEGRRSDEFKRRGKGAVDLIPGGREKESDVERAREKWSGRKGYLGTHFRGKG